MEDVGERWASALREAPVSLGLLACLLGAFHLFLAQALLGRLSFLGSSWISLAWLALGRLAAVFLLAACAHWFAEWAGGRGRATELFGRFGTIELLWAAALPAALILKALAPASRWLPAGLWFLSALAVLELRARALSAQYGFGRGRAWLVLGAPYAAAALAAAAFAALALWGAFLSLSRLFS